jgi:PTH1 family peptidyl-tRNA hydrolase
MGWKYMNAVCDITTIKAIIGLGNPGASYAHNRHSIGFRLIDALAEKFGAAWRATDTMAYAEIRIHDEKTGVQRELMLIKPLTYMNNSGCVIPFLQKKGIKPDQIVVLHDELEKSFGKIVLKYGGSHKGHNGLKSIIGMIGPEFWRLAFGIGRPADKNDVSLYVLSNFTASEEASIPGLVVQALDLLQLSH